ncbi:hypothetical protein pb186bvf_019839 [Paramecium bursaria]
MSRLECKYLSCITGLTSDAKACLDFPDLGFVIAGGTDGSLYKWIYGNQTLTRHTIHSKWINMIIRIQNTNQILTASYDFTCKRIDVTTMTLIGTFTGHTSIVTSVQFFNSTTAISVGNDKTVRIWDFNSMTQLDTLITNHTANVNGAIYFKSLQYIVTASVDKSIMIWNYGDKSLAKAFNGAHTNDINLIQKIQRNVFVSGSTDTTIKVWNLSTLQLIRTISSHSGSINAFGHQTKSQLFLSGSSDMTVQYQSINNCLSNQYFSNQCEDCSIICLSCFESDSYCLTCNVQRQNPPQCSCIDGYWENNLICQQCPFQCLSCTNETDCQTCRGNRQGSNCTCLIGYDDGVSQNCQQCIPNCNTCDKSGCLSCTSIRVRPQCLCPDGYFEDSGCQSCLFQCQTCQNQLACIKCKGDRSGSNCLCPTYKFDDQINVLCQDCIQYCSVCSNNKDCQQCDTNRVFDGVKCGCKQGFYESAGVCIKCAQNCLDCNSSQCQQCAQLRGGNDCKCNGGYYESNNNCIKCNDICSTCQASLSCITCQQNKQPPLCLCQIGFIYQNQQCEICQQNCLQCDIDLKCVQCPENRVAPTCNCLDGYFEENNICNKCQYPCQNCNKSSCLSCSNGQSPPLCQCNDGYFDDGQICKQCLNNCKKCTIQNSCIECLSIRVTPLCSCPDQYYDNGQCIPCSSNCNICKSSIECTQCIDVQKNVPECLCNQGFYYEKSSQQCRQCLNNCLSCNKDNCLVCEVNRSIPQCICNQRYFELNNQCVQCSYQCLTCTQFNKCTTCIDAYREPPDCNCLSNMFELNQQCIQCNSNCLTCNSSGCLSCKNNLNTLPDCLCLQTQYLKEQVCIDCPQNCLTCNQNTCISCIDGFHITQNLCIENPKCNQYCINCTYQGCLQCETNRVVPDCQCQIGYYGNNCTACIENCISCTTQICDKCQDGYEGSWCTRVAQLTIPIKRPYDQTQVVPIIIILSDLIIFVGLAYVGWKMDKPKMQYKTQQKEKFQTIETQRSNKISDQKVTESIINEKLKENLEQVFNPKMKYKNKLPPLENAPKLNKKAQKSFILSLFKNKPEIKVKDQVDILDIEEVNQEINTPQNFLNIDNKHNFILNLDFGGNRSPLPPQTKKNEFKNISVYQVEPEPELSFKTKIKLILQKHLLLKIFFIKGVPRYLRIIRQYSYQLLIGVITGYMALYDNFLVRIGLGLVILMVCRVILHYFDNKCWKIELAIRFILLITALAYRFSIQVDFTLDFLIVFSVDFFILQLFLGTLL